MRGMMTIAGHSGQSIISCVTPSLPLISKRTPFRVGTGERSTAAHYVLDLLLRLNGNKKPALSENLGFATAGNYFGGAQEVNYSEQFPVITPDMFGGDGKALTEAILLTKSKSWDYEAEYRLLLRDEKIDPNFSLTCKDEYLPLPEGALTTVLAGAKCSDVDIEAIRGLLKERAPHVLLKRAVCVAHKYEIAITA